MAEKRPTLFLARRHRAQLHKGACMNCSFLFLVGLLAVLLLTECFSYGDYPSAKLARAIPVKESGNNDQAIGDKKDLLGRLRPTSEWAYGAFQIRQPCVDDVNQALGTRYKASDCLGNRKLSELIFREYINLYATEKRLGHKPTDQDMARIWNGGPNGYKSLFTVSYWAKIQKLLKG